MNGCQATLLGGYGSGLLVITAGWTGARWGELAGLTRERVDVLLGTIRIDRHDGCLHEGTRSLWLGPPKTPASARTITLPRFLTRLLRDYLATTSGEMVFTSPGGYWLRRSCFDRRVFRPAADGNADNDTARIQTEPIVPGLTFHGLRHSHKTWMKMGRIAFDASFCKICERAPPAEQRTGPSAQNGASGVANAV